MPTATGAYATAAAVKARLFAAGVVDTADDTLIGTICDQVNQYIETATGRVLAPISSAVYLFDGDGGRRLWIRNGVRAVSLLEAADATGQAYSTVPSTDYFLRPLQPSPGWPFACIELSDRPSGSYPYFPVGYATVRVTMTTGFAAIPDDITNIALATAVRTWHGRQSGQADIVGNDETGEPVVSQFVARDHKVTLREYRTAAKFGV